MLTARTASVFVHCARVRESEPRRTIAARARRRVSKKRTNENDESNESESLSVPEPLNVKEDREIDPTPPTLVSENDVDNASFFATPESAPKVVHGQSMFEKLEYFFVRAYQPEFHLANIALLLTMGGLMDASGRVEPITTGQCALHEHALGCFYTSELKAMPDELGILGFLAALAWTGYVGALAMKNLKISRAYLLGHGFTEEELEGVTTYTWIRYAEMKVRNGELDVAKAFIERTKQENSFFIRSFSNGEKQYKAPYGNLLHDLDCQLHPSAEGCFVA